VESPLVVAEPIQMAAPVPKWAPLLEYSEFEEESDEEVGREVGSALVSLAHAIPTVEPVAAAKMITSSAMSTSSSSDDDAKAPVVGLVARNRPPSKTTDSSSTESSSYMVSTSNPINVASELGMSQSKLIGGNIVGSLRFDSSDSERGFLVEAGSSFGFPQIERRLMLGGVSCMLENAEDLALKAYVAARCASRPLRMDGGKGSCIAELEERLALLEEEKTGLQGDLAPVPRQRRRVGSWTQLCCRPEPPRMRNHAPRRPKNMLKSGVPEGKRPSKHGAKLFPQGLTLCKLLFTSCLRNLAFVPHRCRRGMMFKWPSFSAGCALALPWLTPRASSEPS